MIGYAQESDDYDGRLKDTLELVYDSPQFQEDLVYRKQKRSLELRHQEP